MDDASAQLRAVVPFEVLDLATVGEFSLWVDGTITDPRARLVVLDMSRVELMTAVALQVVVCTYNRLHDAGRELHLVAGSPSVRRVLEICELDFLLHEG